jgi:rhodanese-related sulfurtransferase
MKHKQKNEEKPRNIKGTLIVLGVFFLVVSAFFVIIGTIPEKTYEPCSDHKVIYLDSIPNICFLIDVREELLHSVGHFNSSINIPFVDNESFASNFESQYRDVDYVLYGSIPEMENATASLKSHGYCRVYCLRNWQRYLDDYNGD